MAEVTNELIYEVLKKVQEQGSRTQDDIRRIRDEISAIRGHMAAFQSDVHNLFDEVLSHGHRLDRIERRLEIAET